MISRQTNPALGLSSFNCPTCGALAHQSWFKVYCDQYQSDDEPHTIAPDAPKRVRENREGDPEIRERVAKFFEERLLKLPFFDQQEKATWVNLRLENCDISKCFSCGALAIWIYDQLQFPPFIFAVEPNPDLSDEIRLDFFEAAKIVDRSPRGAAALLRLCIQKLCVQLGEAGKNIDQDIGNLVRNGLERAIQQALDIVRVIGNEAVHPGQIDLRDDRETAMKLFHLINIIADAMISRPKQIAELYGKLPESKLKAIEKRDSSNGTPNNSPSQSS
jgi:hypothetical protein